jgi:hypothetical protein
VGPPECGPCGIDPGLFARRLVSRSSSRAMRTWPTTARGLFPGRTTSGWPTRTAAICTGSPLYRLPIDGSAPRAMSMAVGRSGRMKQDADVFVFDVRRKREGNVTKNPFNEVSGFGVRVGLDDGADPGSHKKSS